MMIMTTMYIIIININMKEANYLPFKRFRILIASNEYLTHVRFTLFRHLTNLDAIGGNIAPAQHLLKSHNLENARSRTCNEHDS